MSERFYCVNCQASGALDIHARCGTCGSESVVSLDAQHHSREAADIAALEKMFMVTLPDGGRR